MVEIKNAARLATVLGKLHRTLVQSVSILRLFEPPVRTL